MSRQRFTGILDGNHGDVAHVKSLQDLRDAGIEAWIAKVTEGVTYHDPQFDVIIPKLRAAGFSTGAYHFLRGAHSGKEEAGAFLSATYEARKVAPMVLACDWEANDAPADHAVAFVQHVFDVTGVWPLVYTGVPFARSKLGMKVDPVLAKCPLWYAAYGVNPDVPALHPTWPNGYTMMQYTNGGDGPSDIGNYPRKTPGIGGCDRSCFQGDAEAFRAFWRAQAVGVGEHEVP